MKISSMLASVACAAVLLANNVMASPIGPLHKRATNKVIVGYFPNWLYSRYLPANIDFSKYTHINYAFAVQYQGNTPQWADSGVLDPSVQYGFPKLVSLAHAAGVKVVVSVGGWSGSVAFSGMASSAANRAQFIAWNINFIQQYGTDGVDLDWEYPTSTGAGCNAVNANDITNFAALVKEMRAALDSNFPSVHKELTLAVHLTPWGGATIVPDATAFTPYVDRFNVMSFDVNGAWNATSGPNSPLHNTPGWGYPYGLVEGVQSWISAGVPASQIAAGVAFYGRAQTLTVSSTTTQYNPAVVGAPLGDQLDGPWQDAYCSSDSQSASGVWRYTYMRSQGLLTSPTTAASPWIRSFDNVTQTPWLFNPTNKQYISYDDPVSVGLKADYAISAGLAGLFCWSVDEDNGELLAAMQKVLSGNTSPTPITTGATSTSTTATATTTTTKATTTTATTTTTGTKTTTTTSASSTPTGSTSCTSSNNGAMVCVAAGTSTAYQTCVNGNWITQNCGTGTVCQTSGTSIYCGYP
ncbi:glycoside hydrolase superfamily [Umbelopsis sp. PMI_123]|nr:glycoside hydrolase superfamily [Umbelopsis sp. PMI_123]